MKTSLLKGGRVLDPGSSVDAVCDVRVRAGRVDAIGVGLAPQSGDDVIDCPGLLVLPGLIDTHAHVYQYVTGRFGLNADQCGVQSGVTTLVDQGGPSCMTLPGFRHFVAEPAATRVLSFMSAYLVGGLEGHYYPDLYRPDCLDVDATVESAAANPRPREGHQGARRDRRLRALGPRRDEDCRENWPRADLPLYIHFGQLWPMPTAAVWRSIPIPSSTEVIELAEAGRYPRASVQPSSRVASSKRTAGCIRSCRKPIARGLKIDVGHGSHFSFKTARMVLDAGVIPDTLGADMHGYNTTCPRRPARPTSIPTRTHCSSAARSSASSAR